jgi:hypothetical protein
MTLNEFMRQADKTHPNGEIFEWVALVMLNTAALNFNTTASLINNKDCTPEEYVESNVLLVMDTIRLLSVWVSRAGYDLDDLAYEVLGQ